MLDKNSLAQLSQLKKDILSSKDYAEGTVVGANGRFGFVKLDDARSAFLNPERMQKVLPGDRIKVNVVKNDKDQLEAELEKLIQTNSEPFVATYRVKGPNHFVESDASVGGRWLFVPPPFRKRCQDGDYVLAEINKHPFDDGKASVKIITRVGADGDDFLQHNLIIAHYNLARHWSKDAQKQTNEIARDIDLTQRTDFTKIPFVTIDAITTRDMDDAIYAENADDGGWRLWVAVADPGHFIHPSSPLAKAARAFTQSVYLPGRSLPMLPDTLATEVFSLNEGLEKPALIAKIHILSDGDIGAYEFTYGKIRSHKKLSYVEVAAYLRGETDALVGCDPGLLNSVNTAYQLAQARLNYRQAHNLIYDEQPDYDFQLNKQGFIESIHKRERTEGHRLVEEAMLATNLCAGEFLAKHKTGIFAVHTGFRPERLGEVKAVLREDIGENMATDQIQEFDGHIALLRQLQNTPEYRHLFAPLRRMMQNSELSTEAAPHLSMGVRAYATITSPIRRYVDLCNHWSLIQILNGKAVQSLAPRVLEQLQETIQKGRQASRHLEQILQGHYLKNNHGIVGQGVIRIVTQQGFGVRLLENGVEGFIQFSKKVEKNYDAKRMTLQVGDKTFALDQIVSVKIASVDLEKRRVKMELTNTATATPTPTCVEVNTTEPEV